MGGKGSGRLPGSGLKKPNVATAMIRERTYLKAWKLLEKAVDDGVLQAGIYAIDRRDGKPTQQVDSHTSIDITAHAIALERAVQMVKLQEQKQLSAFEPEQADNNVVDADYKEVDITPETEVKST
jgi:hypothetical protein